MRWSTALLAALVGLAVAGSATGCAGADASMTYSADEVREAFESAAYQLVELPPPVGNAAAPKGTYLVPRDGTSLAVFVATDQEADDVWPDYVRLGGDDDSLTVRRANVVAISDGGLTMRAKARVRRAMKALPDRGYAVDVLEDR